LQLVKSRAVKEELVASGIGEVFIVWGGRMIKIDEQEKTKVHLDLS